MKNLRCLLGALLFTCSLAPLYALPPVCVSDTPYAGCIHFAMRTDSSFYNNYTANPTAATKTFMQTHFYRTQVSYGYFENNLSWYPNAWSYINSYGITYGDPIVSQHPEYVLHDASGNPLYVGYACSGSSTALGHCSRYAGNIANEGFRQYMISQHLGILQRGYKGVWLDDVNLDLDSVLPNNNSSGTQTTPIDTNTNAGMTQAAWLGYWATFLTEYNSTIKGAGYEIQENSVWFEGGRPAGGSPNQQTVIKQGNQWLNIERGVTDGGLTAGTGDFSLKALLAYVDQVHSLGRYADIQNFNFSQGGGNNDYVPACYFLISTGLDLMGNDAITPNNWPANYDVDLGTPSGARYNFGNGIRRDFSRGFVVVTPPGTADTTFTLTAGQYTDTAGNPLTSVDIPADNGLIALSTSAPPTTPTVSISPNGWTFGSTTVGSTSGAGTIGVTVGSLATTFTSVALSGANAGDFAITSNTCTGTLAAGATCNTSFTFTPTATGTRTASLVYTNNASGSPQSYGITGTGVSATSALTFDFPSWTFGSVAVGVNQPSGTIGFTNTGSSAITVTSVAMAGANPGDFPITADSCSGKSIAAGVYCSVTFNFAPTAVGTRTASLTWTDSAPASPQVSPIQGQGVTAPFPSLNFSVTTVAFPSTLIGQTSVASTVTTTNNGTADANFGLVSITGLNPGDFAITSNTCTGTLTASSTCQSTVTFTPSATGSRAGNLEFADNVNGSPQDVQLTGTGTAPVSSTVTFSFASWTFGTHAIGNTSGVGSTKMTNTGSGVENISSIGFTGANPGDFAIVSNPCGSSLAAGASCTVTFNFTPTGVGVRTANLAFTDSATGSPQLIAIKGTGNAIPVSIDIHGRARLHGHIRIH